MPAKNSTNCSLQKTTGPTGGAPARRVAVTHEITDERQVNGPLQVAVEVVCRDEVGE